MDSLKTNKDSGDLFIPRILLPFQNLLLITHNAT